MQQISTAQQDEAMFTLCQIGFCSVSKVVPAQCEQELMLCCGQKLSQGVPSANRSAIRYAIKSNQIIFILKFQNTYLVIYVQVNTEENAKGAT